MIDNQIIADLHLHSKYSRAVSKDMVIPIMSKWGQKKGINLMTTGDWLHTLWFRELQSSLVEVSEGIYESKDRDLETLDIPGKKLGRTKFLLSAEISSIYSQGGSGRRVHTIIFAPNFAIAGKISEELLKRGCNLSSDGRPIVGLSCIELAEIVLSISEKCLLIPAHAWTPWFALYGSKSGFDSIEECFGKLANKIYGVETGLSSDPGMNWKIKDLEKRAIVSFSDAHSPAKIGREVTVFTENSKKQIPNNQITNFSYNDIYWAMAERYLGKNEGSLKLGYTIEFYPEEGKYHYTGHRKCNVVQSPEETRKSGTTCHVCGRPLTVGVEHRVDQLADPQLKTQKVKIKTDANGVTFNYHPTDATRQPYVMMVPLIEILAEVYHVAPGAKRVIEEYERLVSILGNEFEILLNVSPDKLMKVGGPRLGEAIEKVRSQDIVISPGYDGEFGKVKIWSDGAKTTEEANKQMGLF